MPTPSTQSGEGLAALNYAPFNFLAPPHWRAIVKLAALKHQVTPRQILSKHRFKEIVGARHEALALVYTHCGHGSDWVGSKFGRDRTTVMYAVKKRGKPAHRPGRPNAH